MTTAAEESVGYVPHDLGLTADWKKKLDDVKAAWGIVGNDLDKKLERLLASSDGSPEAADLASLIRGSVSSEGIDIAIIRSFGELKDLTKSWKSAVKKNRSALA